jgi:hypothetical protein
VTVTPLDDLLVEGSETVIATLAADKQKPAEEKIRDVYLLIYSRPPQPEESAIALAYIQKAKDEKVAYEDILWALINTKEFLFNH